MKMKKIISGVAAASLVVSTVSIVSVVSSAAEIDVWSEAGTIMTKQLLSNAGVNTADYEGKSLTVTYEIAANVPDDAKGWTNAQTVIKYSGGESHAVHFCEELLSDPGQGWVNDHDTNVITNNTTFTYDMTAQLDDAFEVRFGTSNDAAFSLKTVTIKDGDAVVAVYSDGSIKAENTGGDKEDDPNADNTGEELDIWSEAGTVMTSSILTDAGVNVKSYEDKPLTVTYEIAAAVPENAKGWTSAQTVVKYDGGEGHAVHFCAELLDDPNQVWVKEHENNVITNSSTFTYDMTAKMDDKFEVRFGTSNDKAFVLKSVTLKDGDTVIAVYNDDGTIKVENPGEKLEDDPNAGNTGGELDIWSDAGGIMTKWTLADARVDVNAYEGKPVTVVYKIKAAIPENAKAWTSAQTVVKYNGKARDVDNEIHTIHFCEELLDDEGQAWVKDFENNIITNNSTFSYEVPATLNDMFDVRFGTSNDKAFVLESVTLYDDENGEDIASYNGADKAITAKNPVENIGGGGNGGNTNIGDNVDPNAGNTGKELDIWSEAGTVITKGILADAGVNVSAYEGKTLTATYEIGAAVPENAKGWTNAQTVVKYNGGEKHTIHFCEELLGDEGQTWVKDFENNVIKNDSTFTYDMTGTLDDAFEVRFGTSNDKAFVLKSVTLKYGDTVIAVYNSDGSIKVVNPGEDVVDDNAGNIGEELDIWSDGGEVMDKWKLADAGVDVAALDGKALTVTYEIIAAIPENAKGWTSAQTVVKHDGNESHTIHFCEELLSDDGQSWVKDFDNNVIKNNTTFTYDMAAKMDDMFDVRFGTSNDKAFVLKSVTLKNGDKVVAKYSNGKIMNADDMANVNTGVNGMEVVAGIAGIAACTVVVARKKKKSN